jgi:2'-5' RNA ligase
VSRAVCKSALSRGGVAEAESNVAGGVFQKLSLIRSELTPSGPIYSTLHEREL